MPVKRILNWFAKVFGKRKVGHIGIYGPPNAGKTSLANQISLDWMGKEVGKVSRIPHETRKLQMQRVQLKAGGRELDLNIIDMPGVSPRKHLEDRHYESFLKHGLSEETASSRVSQARKGIQDAIKMLEGVETVLLVLDSCENPFDIASLTILKKLEEDGVPVIIVANKTDLKKSSVEAVKTVYRKYTVVPVSCKKRENFDELYKAIAENHR